MVEHQSHIDRSILQRLEALSVPASLELSEDQRAEIALRAERNGRRIVRRRRTAVALVPGAALLLGIGLLFTQTGSPGHSSHGPGHRTYVVVPDVVGLSLPVAREDLESRHLRTRVVLGSSGPRPRVIAELPKPWDNVAVGTTVTIVVTASR